MCVGDVFAALTYAIKSANFHAATQRRKKKTVFMMEMKAKMHKKSAPRNFSFEMHFTFSLRKKTDLNEIILWLLLLHPALQVTVINKLCNSFASR